MCRVLHPATMLLPLFRLSLYRFVFVLYSLLILPLYLNVMSVEARIYTNSVFRHSFRLRCCFVIAARFLSSWSLPSPVLFISLAFTITLVLISLSRSDSLSYLLECPPPLIDSNRNYHVSALMAYFCKSL